MSFKSAESIAAYISELFYEKFFDEDNKPESFPIDRIYFSEIAEWAEDILIPDLLRAVCERVDQHKAIYDIWSNLPEHDICFRCCKPMPGEAKRGA